MLKLRYHGSCSSPVSPPPLPSVRPSLLDPRFTGDAWVVDHQDGTASVRLADYQLARLGAVCFDCPFLNQLLLHLRLCQARRRAVALCAQTHRFVHTS